MKKSKIEKIIEDATTDCHDEEETFSGWDCLFEDQLRLPQECEVNHIQATLLKIVQSQGGLAIHAKIRTKEGTLIAPIETLTLKNRPQNTYIEAYKKWLKGG